MRKARDETVSDSIADLRHDDGNRGGRFLGGPDSRSTTCDDDVHIDTHQLCRQRREAIVFRLRMSIVNDHIFPLSVSKLAEPLPECLDAVDLEGSEAGA
jgi:hypothetical protein